MKYSKEWSARMAELPAPMQQASINYIEWRRWMATSKGPWLPRLRRECRSIERMFRRLSRRCSAGCFGAPQDPGAVIAFADLNSKTASKLCKRADRHGAGAEKAMAWLVDVRASHRYGFMGGAELTRLRYMLPDAPSEECPVCLDDLHADAFVCACGHRMCRACTAQMQRVPIMMNAYWPTYGILRCPVCRHVGRGLIVPYLCFGRGWGR